MLTGKMSGSPGPEKERRRHRRQSPPNVRIRCVSGEYDDLSSGVNFAKRLVNIGQGGMCVETTGRLRAGIKMSAEIRFDDLGGTLRSQALIVWAEAIKEGAVETYLAGFRFVDPEITSTVREFLEGGRASMIVTKRQAEYQDLKQKSEARKAEAGRKKWSAPKKTAAGLFLLIFLYLASFGSLVTLGRTEAPSGVHFRYPKGIPEKSLTTLYTPLTWALRQAGIEITPEPH